MSELWCFIVKRCYLVHFEQPEQKAETLMIIASKVLSKKGEREQSYPLMPEHFHADGIELDYLSLLKLNSSHNQILPPSTSDLLNTSHEIVDTFVKIRLRNMKLAKKFMQLDIINTLKIEYLKAMSYERKEFCFNKIK